MPIVPPSCMKAAGGLPAVICLQAGIPRGRPLLWTVLARPVWSLPRECQSCKALQCLHSLYQVLSFSLSHSLSLSLSRSYAFPWGGLGRGAACSDAKTLLGRVPVRALPRLVLWLLALIIPKTMMVGEGDSAIVERDAERLLGRSGWAGPKASAILETCSGPWLRRGPTRLAPGPPSWEPQGRWPNLRSGPRLPGFPPRCGRTGSTCT